MICPNCLREVTAMDILRQVRHPPYCPHCNTDLPSHGGSYHAAQERLQRANMAEQQRAALARQRREAEERRQAEEVLRRQQEEAARRQRQLEEMARAIVRRREAQAAWGRLALGLQRRQRARGNWAHLLGRAAERGAALVMAARRLIGRNRLRWYGEPLCSDDYLFTRVHLASLGQWDRFFDVHDYLSDGNDKHNVDRMNCYEAVFLIGCHSIRHSRAALQAIVATLARIVDGRRDTYERFIFGLLGQGRMRQAARLGDLAPGVVLWFDMSSTHVCLSLGFGRIASLWGGPGSDALIETSLASLLQHAEATLGGHLRDGVRHFGFSISVFSQGPQAVIDYCEEFTRDELS